MTATFLNETKSNVIPITVTIAAPAVFSRVAHGLTTGDKVFFSSSGVLPTGLTVDEIYSVVATSLTTGSFCVGGLTTGTALNTSGSQSGSHYAHKIIFSNEAKS